MSKLVPLSEIFINNELKIKGIYEKYSNAFFLKFDSKIDISLLLKLINELQFFFQEDGSYFFHYIKENIPKIYKIDSYNDFKKIIFLYIDQYTSLKEEKPKKLLEKNLKNYEQFFKENENFLLKTFKNNSEIYTNLKEIFMAQSNFILIRQYYDIFLGNMNKLYIENKLLKYNNEETEISLSNSLKLIIFENNDHLILLKTNEFYDLIFTHWDLDISNIKNLLLFKNLCIEHSGHNSLVLTKISNFFDDKCKKLNFINFNEQSLKKIYNNHCRDQITFDIEKSETFEMDLKHFLSFINEFKLTNQTLSKSKILEIFEQECNMYQEIDFQKFVIILKNISNSFFLSHESPEEKFILLVNFIEKNGLTQKEEEDEDEIIFDPIIDEKKKNKVIKNITPEKIQIQRNNNYILNQNQNSRGKTKSPLKINEEKEKFLPKLESPFKKNQDFSAKNKTNHKANISGQIMERANQLNKDQKSKQEELLKKIYDNKGKLPFI